MKQKDRKGTGATPRRNADETYKRYAVELTLHGDRTVKTLATEVGLAVQITAAHVVSRGPYWAPRIVEDLREAGARTSKRCCARLMRDPGLRGRKKHRPRLRTTDSRHAQPVAANLIAKRAARSGPNKCWLTNIRYLQTPEGWLYLAAILDHWSRRIVGWACGPTLHACRVLAVPAKALKRRRPPRGLLCHSDRGSQYVDEDYIEAPWPPGSNAV